MNEKGIALIIIILIGAVLLFVSTAAVRFIFSDYFIAVNQFNRARTFYLAEAGIEEGKMLKASNPSWFTDLPHSPPDDVNWLINSAIGRIEFLSEGSFKIVKEQGKKEIYSIGYFRNSKQILKVSPAYSIL